MDSQRELRFYASIPKILFLFIIGAAFTYAAWQALVSGANAVMSWFALGFFGLCTLVALALLGTVIVLRRPLLRINDVGITSFPALAPWRRVAVSWADVAGMGIRAQRVRHAFYTRSTYYLVVQARHPDQLAGRTTRIAKWMYSMYPTLANAAMAESLNMMFLVITRRRRAQTLERIKTTFAPELIQHNIWIDQEERPL